MTKSKEQGLQYILELSDEISKENTNVTIEFVEKKDKVLLKKGGNVDSVVRENSDNYGDILEIIESLRTSYDKD